MRRMLFFAPILGVLLIAGCGGGGGSSLPSPFAGSWTDGQGGNVNVDSKGHIVGGSPTTLSDGTSGNITWQGAVGNDGALSGSVTLTTATQTASLAISGGSNLGTDGHWHGTLVMTGNGKTASAPFDFTRQ
jgi:hypothetical protein